MILESISEFPYGFNSNYKDILKLIEDKSWTEREQKTIILITFLYEILLNVYNNDKSLIEKQFKEIIEIRYKSIYFDNNYFNKSINDNKDNNISLCPPSISKDLHQKLYNEMKNSIINVTKVFEKINNDKISIRDIHIQNYIEDIISLAINPNNVPIFLKLCLNSIIQK